MSSAREALAQAQDALKIALQAVQNAAAALPAEQPQADENDALLLDELERDEGTILHVYPDHLGYLTLGTGRLVDKRKGGAISRGEARYLLLNDVARFRAELDKRLPWWRDLDPVRQRVIQNMAFNLGVPGLLAFKNTLAAVKAGQWDKAAAGMLDSLWARQVGKRAERLAKMMRTGAA